jgi:hypothetical protein
MAGFAFYATHVAGCLSSRSREQTNARNHADLEIICASAALSIAISKDRGALNTMTSSLIIRRFF